MGEWAGVSQYDDPPDYQPAEDFSDECLTGHCPDCQREDCCCACHI